MLTALKKSFLEQKDQMRSKDPEALDDIKNRLFELEETHPQLRDRWLFGQGLAGNLTKCFGEILRLQGKDNSNATYSETLVQRVETQVTLSNMLQQDLDTIPSKIQQQHRMVPISSQFFDLVCALTSLRIDAKLSIMVRILHLPRQERKSHNRPSCTDCRRLTP